MGTVRIHFQEIYIWPCRVTMGLNLIQCQGEFLEPFMGHSLTSGRRSIWLTGNRFGGFFVFAEYLTEFCCFYPALWVWWYWESGMGETTGGSGVLLFLNTNFQTLFYFLQKISASFARDCFFYICTILTFQSSILPTFSTKLQIKTFLPPPRLETILRL